MLALGLAPSVLVAGFADGFLHVIDRTTYKIRRVLSAGPDPVHCLALVPHLRMVVAGTCKGRIATWQASHAPRIPW